MTVINTSPAIHLHAVLPGGLGSLPGMLGEIIIPGEVGQELAAGHALDSTWKDIQGLPGLVLRSDLVKAHPLLAAQIDLGEAAVIQIAVTEGIETVILDDLKARRLALTLGLNVTGTLGILLKAKETGLVPSLATALTQLQRRGMWISHKMVVHALALAGEN